MNCFDDYAESLDDLELAYRLAGYARGYETAPRSGGWGMPLLFAIGLAGLLWWLWPALAPAPFVAIVQAQTPEPTPHGYTGSTLLRQASTVNAAWINAYLAQHGSPAAGTGHLWMEAGQLYNIDPAIAVAFFTHESSLATASGWAGWKPDGRHTYNIGNIICAGASPYWHGACWQRFRDYSAEPNPWRAGIFDWFYLIDTEYIQGRGHRTVADVIPVYAPTFENDVAGYTNTVDALLAAWQNTRKH